MGGVELCCRPYSAGVLHSVSDQIQNLQNCFTAPNKNDQLRRHLGIGAFKVLSSMDVAVRYKNKTVGLAPSSWRTLFPPPGIFAYLNNESENFDHLVRQI